MKKSRKDRENEVSKVSVIALASLHCGVGALRHFNPSFCVPKHVAGEDLALGAGAQNEDSRPLPVVDPSKGANIGRGEK